jgi:chromosome segregation ATPase
MKLVMARNFTEYRKIFFALLVATGLSLFLLCSDTWTAEEPETLVFLETSMPENYFQLAKSYRKKAAYYRQEVQAHRKMKEIFRKSAEKSSGSVKEEWAIMDEKCNDVINLLERLAHEMDDLADSINNDKKSKK